MQHTFPTPVFLLAKQSEKNRNTKGAQDKAAENVLQHDSERVCGGI